MPSDVNVTIKLDPYLQHYLRGFYGCDSEVFSFPPQSRKNYLPYALIEALWYPPDDFTLPDYGEQTFSIAIPFLPDKDINSMNYVSPTANEAFAEVVEKFYLGHWYKFCDKMYVAGYGQKSIVNMFMERYCIDPKYVDRLQRDFTRFQNWRLSKKHRKKSQFKAA